MARFQGRDFTKDELLRRVGDPAQLADARRSTLRGGKAEGVEAVEVSTGSGLAYTVLPGRGMDIAAASYRGTPLAYLSRTGIVGPQFFREDGTKGFLDSFFAGLLTTCGLTHFGSPCVDEGRAFGLHGVASNLPAEDVNVSREWVGDEYVLTVRGAMRQASVFGEHLVLERRIATQLGGCVIRIRDRVENRGAAPTPLMLLYHVNLGWPVVGTDARLHGRVETVRPRDAQAEKGLADHRRFQEPTAGYAEQVFLVEQPADADGFARIALFNPSLGSGGIGVSVAYRKDTLPRLCEWKMMGEGEYVVGLEPATWELAGRAEARRRGELAFLAPGEGRDFAVDIGVLDGEKDLRAFL